MDSSYRRIIKKILKEETMSGNTLTRLLEWYDSWNKKLSEYIIAENYSKIVDIHFKTGLGLLASMRGAMKNHPDLTNELKGRFGVLRSKLIVINDVRKSIDTLK